MNKCLVLFILLLVPCSTMSQNYIIDLTSEESIKNITSPNYPDHYYNNLDIVWQVIAPTGFRVMVQFNVFDLEEGFQGKLGDSLTVDHGFTRSLEDATPRALLSGSSQPDNISSIGSYLWLQFTSDGSVTEKGFSLSVRAVKPDWACDFKEDSCGLKNDEESWAIGKLGNYYNIRAIQDVSSFIIPHAYTSRKGTLSFAYFLSDRESLVMLNVTVCKSQEPFPLGNRGIFKYEYITYSCHGIQDVEITFTATKDNNSTWINVHDIQLYSTSIPSTIFIPSAATTVVPAQSTADEMATPASNGTCPESVGEIERQLSRDVSDLLVINTGRPLPCHGAITRISFYAATTNQITVSVWRRASGNALQLIDLTQWIPERSVTFVSALLPRSLDFAQGDFVGFSSEDLSPLVYSEGASEATEHEVHSFSNLGNYPGLQDGMTLEVTNPSGVIVSNRAYSWKITIEDRQCLYPGLSNGAIAPAGTSVFVNDPITIACNAGFAAAFDTAVCEADGTFTNPIQCNIVKVETRLSLVPILLISALASLFAVAIFVVIVWLVCRRKSRLKHGSSQGIAVSERAVESPGMRDNPIFESSTAHDLRMTDVADCHGGNDPYIALTTHRGGPIFQVYEPLREVNSQGDGYELPINGANGQTGSEFQERPETDYEITHEYQDFKNSVIGRNNSHNESPVSGLQLQPETDYETAHEYEYPSIVGGNIPQYESRIWASGNV